MGRADKKGKANAEATTGPVTRSRAANARNLASQAEIEARPTRLVLRKPNPPAAEPKESALVAAPEGRQPSSRRSTSTKPRLPTPEEASHSPANLQDGLSEMRLNEEPIERVTSNFDESENTFKQAPNRNSGEAPRRYQKAVREQRKAVGQIGQGLGSSEHLIDDTFDSVENSTGPGDPGVKPECDEYKAISNNIRQPLDNSGSLLSRKNKRQQGAAKPSTTSTTTQSPLARSNNPRATRNKAGGALPNVTSEGETAGAGGPLAGPIPTKQKSSPVKNKNTETKRKGTPARKKVAPTKAPRATPARRKPIPTQKQVAEPEEGRDAMVRDYSDDESGAAEGLVQLSRAPVVFDRNADDNNNSNEPEAPASQPQLQSESDEDRGVPATTNRVGAIPENDSLQAFLYRQQMLAGIPPEEMISMTGERGAPTQGRCQGPVNRPEDPSVVQFFGEGGVTTPYIPPAMFEGPMQPPPLADEDSAIDALDLNEEIYGPEGRADRYEGTPRGAIPARDSVVEGSSVPEVYNLAGSVTEPIQHQWRSRMRNQQILPISARSSRHRQSSSIVAHAHVSRDDEHYRNHHAHNGFDILENFTEHLELATILAEFLEPTDLFKLYACSKKWNEFLKSCPPKIVLRQSTQHAPESARIFPFRCYPSLCKAKRRSKNELIPSFSWLLMIANREHIVHSIMEWLRRTGYGLPARSDSAIRKLWFLMDIPDTKRRKWTIEHTGLWSDMDLFLAGLFMIQIDAALQDDDEEELGAMRRLLMAQKSLSVLWKVLSGEIWQTELEIVQSYVRWRYEPRSHERNMRVVLGVPIDEIGLLQYEAYGQHGRNAIVSRPDSLIINELRRRELDIPDLYREALELNHVEPHIDDDHLKWDEALKEEIDGSGLDWRKAVNLHRPSIG